MDHLFYKVFDAPTFYKYIYVLADYNYSFILCNEEEKKM